MVKEGEEAKWFAVFRNQTFPIEHKYYITRLPETVQRQRGMTWEQGRVQEKDFFGRNTCIWKNEAKDRQGTDKLVLALSKRLSIMINKRYTLDSAHR
jgi:hypothetical protein